MDHNTSSASRPSKRADAVLPKPYLTSPKFSCFPYSPNSQAPFEDSQPGKMDPTPKPAAKTTEPKPKPKPVGTVAAKPKTEEPATETADDTCKRRALWIGVSAAAVVVAIGIPLLFKICASEEEKEEEEEKKVASSGAVLGKLVSWVKELTEGEQVEEEEEGEAEVPKYVETASVIDFAKTQSM